MTVAPPFPVIETDRLVLREIVTADLASLFAIHGDPEAMRWFGKDPVPSLEATHELIDAFASWRLLPNPGARWGLQLKTHPTLIGTCGLFKWNRNWQTCTIGYELNQSHQGQGLMGEAADAVIEWGFAELQLNRIEAQIHPKNTASIAMAEKLGFVREGLLREAGFWGGQFEDFVQYSLLRSDRKQ
jgi:[ribosomal protein S5]-alanine N-acetyltransferase